jgi:hypothetical protein
MTILRRQLPITTPCRSFEGRAGTATSPAFCTRCAKPVHDLSQLTEREVVTLLARHRETGLCVSYRARADGAIAMRTATPPLAPAAFALSLTGCAAHLEDGGAATPSDCIDGDGWRSDCPPPPRLADAVIPDDAAPIPDAPVEPTAERPATGELVGDERPPIDEYRPYVSTDLDEYRIDAEHDESVETAVRVYDFSEADALGGVVAPEYISRQRARMRGEQGELARRVDAEAKRLDRRERREARRERRKARR